MINMREKELKEMVEKLVGEGIPIIGKYKYALISSWP